MDIVRSIIYAAAVIGVISTTADICAPEGSMKKQLDTVVGLVLILVVVSPFMNSDFRLRLNDMSLSYDSTVKNDIGKYSSETILKEVDNKVGEYLKEKLRQNNIGCSCVVINAELDEYNQIDIKKVTVTSSGNAEKIRNIISKELPKAQIEVNAGDSS